MLKLTGCEVGISDFTHFCHGVVNNKIVMEGNMIYHYDTYSILVVNKLSVIRRLYTPFEVLCIESIDKLEYGASLFVDELFPDENDLLLFKIGASLSCNETQDIPD